MASPARRALVVGVQHPLDASLPRRPGTCAALRRVEASLRLGGWDVRTLLDDAADDAQRPLFSNLLEGLQWLKAGDPALLVLSAPVVDGRVIPRDGRQERTTLPLSELVAELPGAHVWLDGGERVPGDHLAGWLAAEGPTFLRALAATLVPGPRSLTAAVFSQSLPTEVARGGNLPDPLLFPATGDLRCEACGTPVPDARAAFCPSCGAPLAVEELLDNGRYRLVERLGAGGMGQVYLALDTRLKVRRAIKLLAAPASLPAAERASLQARLIQEARAAQTLSEHTAHVVRVFDVGIAPERGEPYLVMELLEGETLAARLARGALPFADALAIGRVVAEALAVAHARGFVHRDLKPDNIMLEQRKSPTLSTSYNHSQGPTAVGEARAVGENTKIPGTCRSNRGGGLAPSSIHSARARELCTRNDSKSFVKLLDFGLVKAEQAEVKTESGRMMGTLQYMPPEQLKGQGVDARADVFSLGAVLYECFSGQRANPGRTQAEIFGVLLERGVAPLASVAPALPPALCALVDGCLELDPAARPAHAGEVAAALARIEVPSGAAPSVFALTLPSADVIPVPTDESSLPRGELSRPPAGPRRRWVVPVVLAAAGGLAALLWPREVTETPADSQTSARVADAALDAAPPVDAARPLDAAAPAPFTWPSVLPPRPRVERTHEPDGWVRYAGTALDVASALARDLALGPSPPAADAAVEARWAEAPDALRAWLAAGLPTEGLAFAEGVLRAPRARFSPSPPSRRISNGFGTFWIHGQRPPFVEAGRCGRLALGDRLFTARWVTRGYGSGQCSGPECLDKLERALQKARSVGERLEATLTVARGEDEAARTDIPCVLGP